MLTIIRDADTIELLGAVGIMRAFSSKHKKRLYDPLNPMGKTWKMNAKDFNNRFDKGLGKGRYLTDQLNFQISCFDNLKTKSAKQIAKPLLKYTKDYILQLQKEIEN